MNNSVDEKEASPYIGMSVSFLRQSRMEGNRKGRTPGPPFIKIGRSVRYLISDLDAWLKENRRIPASVESGVGDHDHTQVFGGLETTKTRILHSPARRDQR